MNRNVHDAPGEAPELPLAGVLVVALEQAVAAPLCTRKLADAGARVIKVERAEGDFARGYDASVHGGSSYFVWLNRGKESLVLDIKEPADAELLSRIIARADVFIQNLVPGAADRAGFGSATLRARHRRLITCDISGYGESGPYAGMRAYDNLVQAEVGIHAVTGYPDAPAKVGISICDIGAGMHAHAAIIEALFARERTGCGAGLQVSLFGAMADWMSVPYRHEIYGGAAPERSGLAFPTIAPYEPFQSADGDSVIVAIQNDREWRRFCEVTLERPELADDPRFRVNVARVANREALRHVIEEAFTSMGTQELIERLGRGGIAYGRMKSVKEMARHPQLRLQEVETGHGAIFLPADPVTWVGRGSIPPGRVPLPGEHTEGIRREFAD
jgi:itaconate CoA-transferase